MAAAKANLIQEYRNWIWVFILLDYDGGERCLHVFFKKENWPSDGVQLHKRLKPEQSRICSFKNQCQVFCPSRGIANHNDFNLTLFMRIIEVIFGSKYKSLVNDMRNLRNEECYRSNKEIPDTDFDNLWKCTAYMFEKYILN